MRVRKYNGKVYGADLTAAERKAMDIEIKRQIVEFDKKYAADMDALVLYILHTHLGFGKKRLRKFWEAFRKGHTELIEHYDMPDDNAWLCKRFLLEIGVDIDEWEKDE